MKNKFIDLGLPSGTLWANKNFGASSPENKGRYFTFDKAQELGNVPSKEQFEELKNECEWTMKGKGYEVIGPNGNSIYLPVTGRRYGGTDMDRYSLEGYYWSSTTCGDYAYYLCLYCPYVDMSGCRRDFGHSVRLVK